MTMEHFADVLNEYIDRLNLSSRRIAKISGVPKDTVASWIQSRVKRPRNVIDILKVGHALRLTRTEMDRLLRSVKHKSLSELEQTDDEAFRPFLSFLDTAETVVPPLAPPFQAPPDVQTMLGRETQLPMIEDALKQSQTCVLHGMGGVGKTTLATRLAYRLRSAFPDGVLWADLGDEQVSDERMLRILGNFASAYGCDVREASDVDSRTQLVRTLLADKQVLLILDNAYDTLSVEKLLPPTGKSAVLITTRNKRILREQAMSFHIAPLDVPSCVSLLSNIVGEARITAELEHAHTLVDFVGGLPLAIEIVGTALAEAPTLRLLEYIEMLHNEPQPLGLLEDWNNELKNIRASISLSFNRLPSAAQRTFVLLSLLDGDDFSVDAAAALSQFPVPKVKQILGRLYSLSLIKDAPENRYAFHALIKKFAIEKRQEMLGEAAVSEAYKRLVIHFADLIAANRVGGYSQIDQDWLNIYGVLQQATMHSRQQIIHDLTFLNLGVIGYMDAQGRWQEAHNLLEQIETADDDLLGKGKVALKLGAFNAHLGQREVAETHFTAALKHLEQIEQTDETTIYRAYVCEFMSNLTAATNVEDALEWSQKGIELLDNAEGERAHREKGWLLVRQGSLWGRIGDLKQGTQVAKAGLEALPTTANAARISGFTTLGLLTYFDGDPDQASTHWEEAIEHAKQMGDIRRIADLKQNIATFVTSVDGDWERAIDQLEDVLAIYQHIGDIGGQCRGVSNLSLELARPMQFDEALQLLDQIITKARQYDTPEVIHNLINRASIYLEVGGNALRQAQADLQEAEQRNQQARNARWQGAILSAQSRLALFNNNIESSERLIKQAHQANVSYEEELGIIWRTEGDLLCQQGSWDEAETAYNQSLTLFEDNVYEQAHTYLALGNAYANRGMIEEAQTTWKTSYAIFDQFNLHSRCQIVENLMQTHAS